MIQQLLKSKTVKIALLQAVGSVLIVIFTELDMVGYIGMSKSVLDIILRLMTHEAIEDK